MLYPFSPHQQVVSFGALMEIIEVNDVATERRNAMVELIKQHPPDWIVTDETARVGYDYRNYRNVAKVSDFIVYKRVR